MGFIGSTIMIILLTGPTGSGKTDTSWELLSITKEMVFFDCDWFASLQPFSWSQEADVAMVYEALADMIDFHIKRGNRHFVVTLTAEMASLYGHYRFLLERSNIVIYPFRLRCDDDVLKKRVMDRNRPQKHQEASDALVQQNFFDTAFPDNQLFQLVDTTGLSEPEVAQKILSTINT